MGRKAFIAVVCWLTFSQTFGDKRTRSSVQDNDGSESAPRLYRNVPLGVYASAAPYAAYSFHLPTFVASPKSAASHIIPVKEHFVNHLTDSYGNKFVGTPQLSTYKISFPQQFVPLQTKLPEHLAQPLVAAAANFQFNKQPNGQFFGAPFRISALQGPAPTPLNHFSSFGQFYGDKTKNLAPTAALHTQAFRIPNSQQQSTNSKAVFTNTQPQEQYNNYKSEQHKNAQIIVGKPKGQSIQEIPHGPHGEPKFQRIQEEPRSPQIEPKYQNNQAGSQTHYSDAKYQRIQENPHSQHEQHEPNLQQQETYSSDEAKYQRVQELPHYESKFQIIQEEPHSPQPQGEVQFQRTQEAPSQHTYERSREKPRQSNKAKLQSAPNKQTVTYINDINGEKTVVELETKPSLPLLDLTLLEPLTFDNPLVPQVQHFLPRINQATYQKLPEILLPKAKTYQKEFVVQKTMSYDSGDSYQKPKNAPKKKQKKPTQNKYPKRNDPPKKTTVTHHETLDDAPEIVYEINTPNRKETITQKAVSYNRETQSEPVHYSYGSKSQKDPVTYSYSRTAKEPLQVQNVEYGNDPSHLIYHFKPEEQSHAPNPHSTSVPHHSERQRSEVENERESSQESDHYPQQRHHTEEYREQPKPAEEHYEHAHKEKENYHNQNDENRQVVHNNPPKYYSEPAHITSENINFQPILKEYENNIRALTAPSAAIKVDPHQHVQPKSTPQPHVNHREEHPPSPHRHPHSLSAPQENHRSSPEPQRHHYRSNPQPETFHGPAPHIHEKSKRIIIQEEAPDETHMLREQMREEVIKQEENNEEDFEKAYQDAAIGFPAYNQKHSDSEKDIFDPESYGVPRDHAEYEFENTPFQQYQEEGDEFPKESRSRYKDASDKMKQNYYTDFSLSKPESLLDKYQNKLGYYKLFKEQKPEYLVDEEDDDKKQNQKSAKYTAAPSFDYSSSQDKGQSYYGPAKPKQNLYEYDYSKGTPRDSSAYASRPLLSYKSRTRFVEPQFQYGFEPVSLPKLLDSELAAMASNDSPESEKPRGKNSTKKIGTLRRLARPLELQLADKTNLLFG